MYYPNLIEAVIAVAEGDREISGCALDLAGVDVAVLGAAMAYVVACISVGATEPPADMEARVARVETLRRELLPAPVPAWQRVIDSLKTLGQWVTYAEGQGRHDARCVYEWPDNPSWQPWEPLSVGCPSEWADDVRAAYAAAYDRS